MMELRTSLAEPQPPPFHGTPADPLRDALLDSRQRWRDLVALSEDIAFETDSEGRFVFLWPQAPLGWCADELIGASSAVLVPHSGPVAGFNPFLTQSHIRASRAWVNRADGTTCWMSFCAAPLRDAAGRMIGARGVARDLSEVEQSETTIARALRRGALMDHLSGYIRSEPSAPRALIKALEALTGTIGADGAMIIESDVPDDIAPLSAQLGTSPDPGPPASLLHEVGGDRPAVRLGAIDRLREGVIGPMAFSAASGERCLLAATPTRFYRGPGVVAWREPGGRLWDADEMELLFAVLGTVRVVLDVAAMQRQLANQARTDLLTGLANRRAFMEDVNRRIERLDRDGLPGTVMFVDLDNFKALNDSGGHEAGDLALQIAAQLLRAAVRPNDVVARFGGDEFAVWLDGADELTAAERAEQLRLNAPHALAQAGERMLISVPPLSMSVGIASRPPGSGLELAALLHRADTAMYLVKRSGRGHWRVWHGEYNDAA